MEWKKETINYDISREAAIEEAKRKGLNVIYPKRMQLLLDMDSDLRLLNGEEFPTLFLERKESDNTDS